MTAAPSRRGGKGWPKADRGTIPQIEWVPVRDLKPATINDVIYKPVRPDDPAVKELTGLVREFGVKVPLAVTLDDVVLSGHRRLVAAIAAGLEVVPVIREPFTSGHPDFDKLLVTFNQQRDKDPGELIREQLVLTDPEEAYRAVASHRAEKARVRAATIDLGERRRRSRISRAKRPFLDAVLKILEDLEDYLPLTDRAIFYQLLNAPPLVHASKPESRFRNNKQCYKATTDLLARARIEGLIPWDSIGDETRPVTVWQTFPNVGAFMRREIDRFGNGYARDLTMGQPNHVEIVGEKNTVEGTIRPVAMEYRIPYTIGRGYCSLPPRHDMHRRFKASGKERLVILFLSDHDPEGVDIPSSFAQSMRDDFGIQSIDAVKVGLNAEQVRVLNLAPNSAAGDKSGGARFKKFSERYGLAAYELEAVPPELLRQWLREAIASVIDVGCFNAQVAEEKRECATAVAFKKTVDYMVRMVPEDDADDE